MLLQELVHAEFNSPPEVKADRISEILTSIEETGTYRHTLMSCSMVRHSLHPPPTLSSSLLHSSDQPAESGQQLCPADCCLHLLTAAVPEPCAASGIRSSHLLYKSVEAPQC